jgi:hypothetical protein
MSLPLHESGTEVGGQERDILTCQRMERMISSGLSAHVESLR